MMMLRRKLTDARRNFLTEVLSENPYVRIEVVPYGAREATEVEFRKLLQREDSGFEKDIGSPDNGGFLGQIYQDVGACEKTVERNLMDVKNYIRNIADGKDDVSVMDQRFSKHIRKLNPESIDRLETWFPEDSLDVQYSATRDGAQFLSIKEGSPGQKTATYSAIPTNGIEFS